MDAAALHQLDVEDATCPRGGYQGQGVALVEQRLVGGQPRADRFWQFAHGVDLVGRHRLLEKLDVQRLGLGYEAANVIGAVALIRIDPDADRLTDSLAQSAQPLEILFERVSELDL